MDKLSDRLDLVDKVMDLRNYYLECQKCTIINDIKWLEQNANKPDCLRLYFVNLLGKERILQIGDKELSQLAEIRGNYLFAQLYGLEQQKIANKPLKVIVQELKLFGQ